MSTNLHSQAGDSANKHQPGHIIVVGPSGSTGNDYTGTGTTDQTAIQNAANAGYAVMLKAGSYVTTAPVALRTGSHIFAESPGSVTITSAMGQTAHQGIFTISNKNDITIEGIKFVCNGSSTAATSYGHDGLTIRDCTVTGTSDAFGGFINLDGDMGSASMTRTRIERVKFYSAANIGRCIHLYPRNSNIVEDTVITSCTFDATMGSGVNLDAYTTLRGTVITHNKFTNLIYGGTVNTTGVAVQGKIGANYEISNTIIANNTYRNTLTTSGHQQGFVYIYGSYRTTIIGNSCEGSWTTGTNIAGPCIAPGRTSSPDIGLVIAGNQITGFDACWDPDSMIEVEVYGNVAKDCGTGFDLGYGTQKFVHIHDNILYNCTQRVYNCCILLANATPVKCKINNNTYIDDSGSPLLTYFMEATGHFNFSDVEVRDNKVYCPSGTVGVITKEFGDEVSPRVLESNDIHDSTGITREYVFAQGNVTGATTLNVAKAPIITATLTGNITVTLTSGTFIGQTLELRLTQDGTGSRTATWPANFKKAGGTLTLSTGAAAVDRILMKYDGTNWIEVSRSLNVS